MIGLSEFFLHYIVWIAGFVAAAWMVPSAWQRRAMSFLGLAFLASVAPGSLVAYSVVVGITLVAARTAWRRDSRLWVAVAILAGLGVAFKAMHAEPLLAQVPVFQIVGFSFLLLKAIHYLVESRAGRLPAHSPGDFFEYMVFFPTLLAGPIIRYPEFHREALLRRWDAQRFSVGLERMLFGYVKLVVVAGYLINWRLDALDAYIPQATFYEVYWRCLRYGLNLYFAFAGMSDVAIGAALAAGLRVPENFTHPFLARNIVEFWRSWHITLSRWCSDYVFVPVAHMTRRPALAVGLSMLVLGIWHELSFRYIAWAAYHALGIVAYRGYDAFAGEWVESLGPRAAMVHRAGASFVTFNFVVLGFLITASATPVAALQALVRAWESGS